MRRYLINKNLCPYYWSRERIGKELALEVAKTREKAKLIFGKDTVKC